MSLEQSRLVSGGAPNGLLDLRSQFTLQGGSTSRSEVG
ncbi:hypothetical protein NAEX_02278 [Nannocystis exedens]|nr:hypothetical protein NAEX_02278 [Nannocystis exedens]